MNPRAQDNRLDNTDQLLSGLLKFAPQGADEDKPGAPNATLESTELDNGVFYYRNGALAQGSLGCNDVVLAEATASGQVIRVAGGAVTAIAAAEDLSTATDRLMPLL
ncbi:MAG: hypothetical protein ACRYFR_18340 [Janthinobacterium lividum]